MQETFARICEQLSALSCDKTDFAETEQCSFSVNIK